jgi:hypothetical protein
MTVYPSGIRFPFTFSPSGGVEKADGADKIGSNLKALVLCDIRDRFVYKELGVVSYQSVLRNFTDSFVALFKKFVTESVLKYEPRAKIATVNILRLETEDGYKVIAQISYIFKNSGEFATLSLELKEV